MRILSISILIILSSISVNAQITVNEIKNGFKNQGEQENYWAEEAFKTKYKKQFFKRFHGTISLVNETTFTYRDRTLIVNDTNIELKTICKIGLLYPEIITGKLRYKPLTKKELTAMTSEQKQLYDMVIQDGLTISNLEELRFLNTIPQIKRYSFLLFEKGFSNPTICYMELTNERALPSTSVVSFIEGSKLTFFKRGSIII